MFRLLSGKRGGSEVDVSAFLAVCRVKGDDRDQLLALCREQNTPGWFQQHGSRLPKQLMTQHLLRISTRSYLTLRVIPASLGAHAATAGPFIFMEFAEFRPVVYLESATSTLFLETPEEIAAYQDILGALAETALGERESKELIATLTTALSANREDHDDRA